DITAESLMKRAQTLAGELAIAQQTVGNAQSAWNDYKDTFPGLFPEKSPDGEALLRAIEDAQAEANSASDKFDAGVNDMDLFNNCKGYWWGTGDAPEDLAQYITQATTPWDKTAINGNANPPQFVNGTGCGSENALQNIGSLSVIADSLGQVRGCASVDITVSYSMWVRVFEWVKQGENPAMPIIKRNDEYKVYCQFAGVSVKDGKVDPKSDYEFSPSMLGEPTNHLRR
ncbi:MAG: hypothetical protein WC712_13025, partial [Candidatus Brocadiia bacterium]